MLLLVCGSNSNFLGFSEGFWMSKFWSYDIHLSWILSTEYLENLQLL